MASTLGNVLVDELVSEGGGVGRPLAVAIGCDGVGLAAGPRTWALATADPAGLVDEITAALNPRWVWWSVPAELVDGEATLRTCWDLGAVHRVLHGGRRQDPPAVWAAARGLSEPEEQRPHEPDLFDFAMPRPVDPVDADTGLLDPEWRVEDTDDAARWAALALAVQVRQEETLRSLPDPRVEPGRTPLAILTAHAESAGALMAAELEHIGLPIDLPAAEEHIAAHIGRRPVDDDDEAVLREARDDEVLRHFGRRVDLRNAQSVRTLMKGIGIDIPDTRSWRLKPFRDSHPGVAAFLDWRTAERIATTYGYRWLDQRVGPDHRLRGGWSPSDGAAGRMTAGAGLHNLPATLRVAVAAEPGHVFVRADLGQIEPRVLAVVSDDPELVSAAGADDMYAPVAEQLRCDRPTAKVAVLAAMYGQTTGVAGEAFERMERTYPKAIDYLRSAEESGRTGVDIRTWGGRLIRLRRQGAQSEQPMIDDPDAVRSTPVTGSGRFARNAVIQGAAAELFKAWAATVRIGLLPYGGRIVLCLHDELLVHVPEQHADDVAALVVRSLDATAAAWAAGSGVRFVTDCSIVHRWSEAK